MTLISKVRMKHPRNLTKSGIELKIKDLEEVRNYLPKLPKWRHIIDRCEWQRKFQHLTENFIASELIDTDYLTEKIQMMLSVNYLVNYDVKLRYRHDTIEIYVYLPKEYNGKERHNLWKHTIIPRLGDGELKEWVNFYGKYLPIKVLIENADDSSETDDYYPFTEISPE